MDFLRVCVLGAALVALGGAFTHQDMKDALLHKLGLDEVPKIHKRDLENLVVPAHIRNKYLSMLKLHHSRRRRSLPSLAGILRGIPGNAGKDKKLVTICNLSLNENHLSVALTRPGLELKVVINSTKAFVIHAQSCQTILRTEFPP